MGTISVDSETYNLAKNQYVVQSTKKSLIVLHHTCGSTAEGAFSWWQQDPRRIGTAFIVDKDGTIYEVFPRDCWAWHLGVKDQKIEERSIGIEIVSEGGLELRGNDDLYWCDGKAKFGSLYKGLGLGKVYRASSRWRGFLYFAAYTQEQVRATIDLVKLLCEEFKIPKKLPQAAINGMTDLPTYFNYKGVLHHAMLRDDKTDLHMGFPFLWLGRELQDVSWIE